MDENMQEIEAIVRGRVQMVMYRDFAQRKAKKLGLVGAVQNLSDGTVRVVAVGNEERLKQYIEYLQKGPVLSRVDKVDVQWIEPSAKYTSFDIVY
jgi:acylphosphatase